MTAACGQAAPVVLPPGCEPFRSMPVFTEATVPAGLLRSHRTARSTWGLIRVLEGRLLYRVLDLLSERVLDPSSAPGVVEPNVPYEVVPLGPVRFQVKFHCMADASAYPAETKAVVVSKPEKQTVHVQSARQPTIKEHRRAVPLAMFAISVGWTSLWPIPAEAHVKWFAPYIVGAPPAPVSATLTDGWFWLAIVLVLSFFVATRALERSSSGEAMLRGMDRATDPLWRRLDDFVRAVIAAFFVAIFAVGGVYLTPDLKTPAEWVSWAQLLIAAGIFSRRTMPLSAAGIIGLWALALRDYDLFHLLDYLALGIGVAAYLVLEASNNPQWRKHRFEMLRWGVAIALMWSSLEKFAYPDWFSPLVVEKPFLTFGMPEHVFVPMAGVAEFTMGFGLIWTPLVRRLSAITLFVIFNAAVYPFGRIDMIGHALIMAIIVAIAADQTREVQFMPALKRSLAGVPAGLAVALVVFVTGYWSLHLAFYGPEGSVGPPVAEVETHSRNPEQPHGPQARGGIGAPPDRGPGGRQ